MHPIAPDARGVEELFEPFDDPCSGVVGTNEVHPASIEIGNRRFERARSLDQTLAAKGRQDAPSLKQQDGGGGRGRCVHLARAMILESRHTGGVAVESERWEAGFGVVASG